MIFVRSTLVSLSVLWLAGCTAAVEDPSTHGTSSGGSSGGTHGGAGAGGSTASGAGTAGSAGNVTGTGGTPGAGGTSNGGSAMAGSSSAGTGTGAAGSNSGGGSGPIECGGIAIPMGSGEPSGGTLDQWTDVTPDGIDLDGSSFSNDNFGLQDVLVDPVRPSDFYAFICHQGVYKSTDYGQNWVKINTGTNGDKIDSGKPWGEGIDSNRCRDPETPVTLYSAGSQGKLWKSIDGGVNWTSHDLPEDGKPRPQDVYDVDVDPYDGSHLIAAFHEETGLAQSTDAGETWTSVTMDDAMSSGASWYAFFLDTGMPETTRTTWLMIAQVGGPGTFRTSDAGASWTNVDHGQHLHGGAQLFQWHGAIYMAQVYSDQGWGVLRSTDVGETWTRVSSGQGQAVVYGTPSYVYAQPAPFGNQQYAERAAQPGASWSFWPLPMGDGPKRAAVSYDGTHYVVVTGNWQHGLWRYVEP